MNLWSNPEFFSPKRIPFFEVLIAEVSFEMVFDVTLDVALLVEFEVALDVALLVEFAVAFEVARLPNES
jgi:hypothetical protein